MLCYPTSMRDEVKEWRKTHDDKTIQSYIEYLEKHHQKQNKGYWTKDSEKLKTYKAEWAFQREYGKIKQFDTIRQAQKRCDQITASECWKKIRQGKGGNGIDNITVQSKSRNTGRRTAGWANVDGIVLDLIAGLDEYTLIHEIAHCAGNWHHGRSFRRDLLKLVSRFMGREAATILKAKFKEKKLACGEPRKAMEFEKWLETKERMAKMRSAI